MTTGLFWQALHQMLFFRVSVRHLIRLTVPTPASWNWIMKWPVVLQRSSPLIFRVLGCLLFHFVTGFQKLGEPFSDGYSVFYLDGIFSSLSTSDNVQLLVNLEGPTFSRTEAWEWMQPPRPCRASGEAAPRWPVLLCSRRWTHVLWRPLPDRLPGLLRVLSSGGLDLWGYSWLLEKKKGKQH